LGGLGSRAGWIVSLLRIRAVAALSHSLAAASILQDLARPLIGFTLRVVAELAHSAPRLSYDPLGAILDYPSLLSHHRSP
jgi:hypothetical protein